MTGKIVKIDKMSKKKFARIEKITLILLTSIFMSYFPYPFLIPHNLLRFS